MKPSDELNDIQDQLESLLDRRFQLVRESIVGGDSSHLLAPPHIPSSAKITKTPVEVSQAISRALHSGDLQLLKKDTIAYLGSPASFTHKAAVSRFGSAVKYHAYPTIAAVFEAVETNCVDFGVVPVENSTEGAVKSTLDRFIESDIKICGEVSLKVVHNLLSNCHVSDIKRVYSHPQAISQCRNWLTRNLPNAELIETSSTTSGAERAFCEENAAAVAGTEAAKKYQLNLLNSHIEDIKGNTTRFMVISDHAGTPSQNDKTSILACTKDQAGALYKALDPFQTHGVSMTMIESRPSKRKSWEYFFFIDFLGHVEDTNVQKMLQELSSHCQFVKVLGSYPRAINN